MKTRFRIKFQEAGGQQLKKLLSKDLGRGQLCGRSSCPPFDQSEEKRQNCRINIMYESKCLLCYHPDTSPKEEKKLKKDGRNGIYYGETSRSFQERMNEYVKDGENYSVKSHIIKQGGQKQTTFWILHSQDL